MKGKVEVFHILSDGSEAKVFSGPNMTVDGAGETIVDMLTLPASIRDTEPRVFDASNWRINAMSFGPPKGNFGTDPDRPDTSCSFIVENEDGTVCGVPANYATERFLMSPWTWANINRAIPGNKVVRALWVPESVPFPSTSSYTPPLRLPTPPSPLDTKLEDQDSAYALAANDGTKSYGQFENRIGPDETDSSSYLVGAYAVGYTPTDPNNFWIATVSSITDTYNGADSGLNIIASADGIGSEDNYNGKDSGNVDFRGYIRTLPYDLALTKYTGWDPNVKDSEWEGRAWFSGVGSQSLPVDLVTDPRVRFDTTIHKSDVAMFNMYGGLNNIGLWTLDVKKCLANTAAPFTWSLSLNAKNDREYRLFAKRTFTENMARITDVGAVAGIDSYESLRISWTLDFRSGR